MTNFGTVVIGGGFGAGSERTPKRGRSGTIPKTAGTCYGVTDLYVQIDIAKWWPLPPTGDEDGTKPEGFTIRLDVHRHKYCSCNPGLNPENPEDDPDGTGWQFPHPVKKKESNPEEKEIRAGVGKQGWRYQHTAREPEVDNVDDGTGHLFPSTGGYGPGIKPTTFTATKIVDKGLCCDVEVGDNLTFSTCEGDHQDEKMLERIVILTLPPSTGRREENSEIWSYYLSGHWDGQDEMDTGEAPEQTGQELVEVLDEMLNELADEGPDLDCCKSPEAV